MSSGFIALAFGGLGLDAGRKNEEPVWDRIEWASGCWVVEDK